MLLFNNTWGLIKDVKVYEIQENLLKLLLHMYQHNLYSTPLEQLL